MKKQLLSFILLSVFVFQILSVSALAGEANVVSQTGEEENPYVSLAVEDAGNLYLVWTRRDGTVEREKAVLLDVRMGDEDVYGGLLTTDKNTYLNARFYFYPQCTQNVRLVIDDFSSNVLPHTNWLALQMSARKISAMIQNYRWYAEHAEKTFDGFNGVLTVENKEAIITIAVNVCDCFDVGEIGEDGNNYGIFDVAAVKRDVASLFGIEDVDLSDFSGYDAAHPQTVKVLETAGGSGLVTNELTFCDGTWTIAYHNEETDEFMQVILNQDAKIKTISFGALVPGDADNDGELNMKDVLMVRKWIARVGGCENLVAADCDGDGTVTMKDVLSMRRMIAGLA